MINQEISEILVHMAEILEFLGDPNDHFKVRALQNASVSILDSQESLERLVDEKRLREIPAVGQGIAAKIEEYIETGRIREYELLKRAVPKGFFELLGIPFLGPKKVKALHDGLNIKNIEDLKRAISSGRVQKLNGFGEKSAQKIMEGIGIKALAKGRRRIGEVFLTVNEITDALKKCPSIRRVVPAGSFRRAESAVGDIDILVTGANHKAIMDYFIKQKYVGKILNQGGTKATILTKDGLQVDLRVVDENQFGSALQYFTGSKLHNVHLRTFAKNRGFKLSEYGFFKGGKLIASKTEEDCYRALGMQYIPPELRADTGEIEAAYKHKLPRLIELGDIKGDLHTHSVWSDGGNSIEQMAVEAQKLGYEYIALTDHSPSLRIARGLTLERLKKKKREIDKLNSKMRIRILFGTEADILADGKIDYSDEILREFDVVVASIHSRMGQDNTARLIKAMENKHVHIIGHPSGRLIGKRNPYVLDYEKIFKAAAKTGTSLEINAHYERLDLQDRYIREAKRWGCRFALNTDAHSLTGLNAMSLGVKWASRGWAEKTDVINTLPLKQLLMSLREKRSNF